jgi:exonuclease VII small subunit
MSTASQPIEITFPEAYEQLKAITTQLNGADRIGPDELVDLLMRGKGLERVLRARLDEVEQKVKAIESGDELTAYRIVAERPAPGGAPAARSLEDDVPF